MKLTRSKNKLVGLACGLTVSFTVAGCASTPQQTNATVAPTPPARAVARVPATMSPTAVSASDENPTTAIDAESGTPVDQLGVTPEADDGNYDDLWARIRAGFALEKLDSPLIARHERWFVENAEFREAMLDRAKLYLYYIVEEVEKRGMPMEIALLPAIESAYKPYAYSRARASGLWQFIPSTGKLYGLKSNWWYDGRRDVVAATRAALDYLQKLHNDFDGDWHLAIAAYNAGEGRVMRAIQYNRRKGLPTSYEHLRALKPETKHYVPKLFAMVHLVADPAKFGITLAAIPNEPYFTTVHTDAQIDLGVVARLTGMETDDLHHINAGYMRWATHPDGPHQLLVPVDKKDALLAGLESLEDKDRVQWRHHEVRKGETLHGIARRYGVTIEAIKAANKVAALRVGQSLLLPISAHAPVTVASTAHSMRVRGKAGSGQLVVHRVRAGDTLWSLARRYNVLVRHIAEWNRMRPNEVLRMGRKIKIWTSGGNSARLDHATPLTA